MYLPHQQFSGSRVSFVCKGSHLDLPCLRPLPFDISCFTTDIVIIMSSINAFYYLKAARPLDVQFLLITSLSMSHMFMVVHHVML